MEQTVEDLRKANCLLEDENGEGMDLVASNFGIIASHYRVKHQTLDTFSSFLANSDGNLRHKHLLDLLCQAAEFDEMPLRPQDDLDLAAKSKQCRYEISSKEP